MGNALDSCCTTERPRPDQTIEAGKFDFLGCPLAYLIVDFVSGIEILLRSSLVILVKLSV